MSTYAEILIEQKKLNSSSSSSLSSISSRETRGQQSTSTTTAAAAAAAAAAMAKGMKSSSGNRGWFSSMFQGNPVICPISKEQPTLANVDTFDTNPREDDNDNDNDDDDDDEDNGDDGAGDGKALELSAVLDDAFHGMEQSLNLRAEQLLRGESKAESGEGHGNRNTDDDESDKDTLDTMFERVESSLCGVTSDLKIPMIYRRPWKQLQVDEQEGTIHVTNNGLDSLTKANDPAMVDEDEYISKSDLERQGVRVRVEKRDLASDKASRSLRARLKLQGKNTSQISLNADEREQLRASQRLMLAAPDATGASYQQTARLSNRTPDIVSLKDDEKRRQKSYRSQRISFKDNHDSYYDDQVPGASFVSTREDENAEQSPATLTPPPRSLMSYIRNNDSLARGNNAAPHLVEAELVPDAKISKPQEVYNPYMPHQMSALTVATLKAEDESIDKASPPCCTKRRILLFCVGLLFLGAAGVLVYSFAFSDDGRDTTSSRLIGNTFLPSVKNALVIVNVQDCFLEGFFSTVGRSGSRAVPDTTSLVPLVRQVLDEKACFFDLVLQRELIVDDGTCDGQRGVPSMIKTLLTSSSVTGGFTLDSMNAIDNLLQDFAIEDIYIMGISESGQVEDTANSLQSLGYETRILLDATRFLSQEATQTAVTQFVQDEMEIVYTSELFEKSC